MAPVLIFSIYFSLSSATSMAAEGVRLAQVTAPTSTAQHSQSGMPLIAADRLPLPGTWENAGVEGGIPHRTTICADVTQAPYLADKTATVSAVAAIQKAIDACPDNQVVYVPAGNYKIDNRISINTSITLRGSGPATVFQVSTGNAILMRGTMPWPPPKNNPSFFTQVAGTTRGSISIIAANAASVQRGSMVMIDEEDDPDLVWARPGGTFRSRASTHMVEAKNGPTLEVRPPLPIDYVRSPRLSVFPHVLRNAGVENIAFTGNGKEPRTFIEILSAWNVWVTESEFSNMPYGSIMAAWAGHLEFRKNLLRDQSNGGSNSHGILLFSDVNWSLVVDNICSAGGFPGISIRGGGAGPNYSGGVGNVVAYNYCVDSYYTDPPTSRNHGIMAGDIGGNHSPHPQFNLFEGNIMGKFHADAIHGSGSHAVLFRNLITGNNKWEHAVYRTAVQIDRRNLYYSIVGNVLGERGKRVTHEYAQTSNWSGSAIYRLGFPDLGNVFFLGTHPPLPIANAFGGPRDLYVDRNNTKYGTTLIEGNWTAFSGKQDWTVAPRPLPDSMFLASKPAWFGDLAWPPVDPSNPVTNDPTIIPAGYRVVHGKDVPGERRTAR